MTAAFQSPDYAAWYRPDLRVDPTKAALVVIDLQVGNSSREGAQSRLARERGEAELLDPRFRRIEEVVVPTLQTLLQEWRSRGLKVAYAAIGSGAIDFSDMHPRLRSLCRAREMREGRPEYQILDQIAPQEGEPVFRKTTMSAFASSGLAISLRNMGVDALFLAGVSTDQCVLATALDASEQGFQTVLIDDCCGASRDEYHQAATGIFSRFAGGVTVADDIWSLMQ